MNNEIMVSVLITYYNQVEYVKTSLQSVLSQKTDFIFEVLCGDDGSSDGTYEELLKWKKKYPNLCRVYRMPRDNDKIYEPIVRASNNRHNLLKHAKGRYVTFLDGDDYYTDKNKLQSEVTVLEMHPDCSASCHPMRMVWKHGNHKSQYIGKISDRIIRIKNTTYWASMWLPSEAFIFRNYYRGNEDRINRNLFDDNLITIYFVKYGDIIFMPNSMVDYLQHDDSSWNSRTELQKAYVNMLLYQESKMVLPNMKWESFCRCQQVMSIFFRYRNEEIHISNSDHFIVNEKLYIDTLKYRTSSIWFKFFYLIKYFVPCHMNIVLSIINKCRRFNYRNI